MRLSVMLVASLSALPATPTVSAAEERLQGFALEADRMNYSSAIRLKTSPIFDISAGGFKIVLEETTLAQIAEQFGGKIHSQDWIRT